jgi:hypothetical protein
MRPGASAPSAERGVAEITPITELVEPGLVVDALGAT